MHKASWCGWRAAARSTWPVDIRRGSPTFGRGVGVTLDAAKHQQMWIPAGFAHAFLALEDETHFLYSPPFWTGEG